MNTASQRRAAYSTERLTSVLARITVINQMVDQAAARVEDDQLSSVFAALADPTRRDIVARLASGDATVNELAAPYDVSLQAVSKHLRVLENARLVTRSREAQRRPVHLEAKVLDLMTAWIERYRREAEERFQRLDEVLRSMPDVDPTPPSRPKQDQQSDQGERE